MRKKDQVDIIAQVTVCQRSPTRLWRLRSHPPKRNCVRSISAFIPPQIALWWCRGTLYRRYGFPFFLPSTKSSPAKRTRQNIAKMEKRRLARERHQQSKLRQQNDAAEQKHLPLNEQQRRRKESKKNATQSRRQRKEKQRAREVADQGDAMDIG
jgi:hypothetical protein